MSANESEGDKVVVDERAPAAKPAEPANEELPEDAPTGQPTAVNPDDVTGDDGSHTAPWE